MKFAFTLFLKPRVIMRKFLFCSALAASALFSATANAAPLRIQFEGSYTDQWAEFMPFGTSVKGEFMFEFANPEKIAKTEIPEITSVSGKLSWGNGYAESVLLNSASWNSYGTDGFQGELTFAFPASFSTNGRQVDQVYLNMFYPDNPYTSTRSWDGLAMISTTGSIALANFSSGAAAEIKANSWTVSRAEVPEPGTLSILGLGLLGLAGLRRKQLASSC